MMCSVRGAALYDVFCNHDALYDVLCKGWCSV